MTGVFGSLDELRAALGTKIGPSPWLSVSQRRINEFADVTEDHQWPHVDIERAAASHFGGTIAHGFLTLSLIPRFNAQLCRTDFGSARVNYGLNKVRFPTTVPAEGRLRAYAEFLSLEPSSTGHLLTTRFSVELENASKPACVAEMLTLLVP
ncbi:MaoC family dehydratase [Nocardia sp. NBC_01377]|uniref:MaoC family dehydratase n=1 Tax=Nocardia TaxID=1817 RepID=UPI001C213FCC|nr:MaoC family dehydratase [Nocardia noduli]